MHAEAAFRIEAGHAMRSYERSLHIGGIWLEVRGASSGEVRLGRELESFCGDHDNPEIFVHVDWVAKLQHFPSNPAFDSGSLWRLFRDRQQFVFDFTSPAFSQCPYKRVYSDPDFRRARLFLSREA